MSRRPPNVVAAWVTWFERRGVYAPGTDDGHHPRLRDFGVPLCCWLAFVALFVVFFAIAT